METNWFIAYHIPLKIHLTAWIWICVCKLQYLNCHDFDFETCISQKTLGLRFFAFVLFALGFDFWIWKLIVLKFVFPNFSRTENVIFRNFATVTDNLRERKIWAILRASQNASFALPYYEKCQKIVSSYSVIPEKNDTIFVKKDKKYALLLMQNKKDELF